VWDAGSGELLRSLPSELLPERERFPVVPYPTVTGPVRLVVPSTRPKGTWDVHSSVEVSQPSGAAGLDGQASLAPL
jgi:hypothetical protein